MNRVTSFQPLLGQHAKVLILGSMPGEKSLQMNQYYAHQQNSFWYILGKLIGFDPASKYEQRVHLVTKSGICVWDVLKSCVRQGSLDSAIENTSAITNDFAAFLSEHQAIKTIIFNGTKAEQLFKKHVLPTLDEKQHRIALIRLPSTSPAHAAMSKSEKLAKWRVLSRILAH